MVQKSESQRLAGVVKNSIVKKTEHTQGIAGPNIMIWEEGSCLSRSREEKEKLMEVGICLLVEEYYERS